MARTAQPERTAWTGWIFFAAALLVMIGLFNVIEGLAAVFSNDVFVNTGSGIIVLSLASWGWIHFGFGVAQAVTGLALLAGQAWARFAAVLLVALNAIAQLMFLTAYPIWSLLVILLDLVVLWALIVHGEETARPRSYV